MTHTLRRIALSIAMLSVPLAAQAGMALSGTPVIKFFAQGSPGFLDIEGVSKTMTVADDGTNLVFTVPMKTVTTGIGERDAHMNDTYVQVAQFPNAILTLKKADIAWPTEVGKGVDGTLSATFNVHGQNQPVSVTYSVRKSKTGWRVTASFKYDASASGIAIPDYLGITVDPKQHAEVVLDLVEG